VADSETSWVEKKLCTPNSQIEFKILNEHIRTRLSLLETTSRVSREY